MIYPVTHDAELIRGQALQQWCGPAAVSALTGRSAECAAAWINHDRGKPIHHKVRGTYDFEVIFALRALGYDTAAVNIALDFSRNDPRPTFAEWLLTASEDAVYLVDAGKHWMVVHAGEVVCSKRQDPVWYDEAANLRCRMVEAHLVAPLRGADNVRRKRLDPLPTWTGPNRPYKKSHELPR